MQRNAIDHRLLQLSQYALLLIPLTCAVSRAASDVMLIICAVFFLIHSALMRDGEWLKARWVQAALALWGYVLVSSFFATDVDGALGRSAAWLRFPVFTAACTFWLLRKKTMHKKLILSLSIAVGFMIIDTLIQYFFGHDLLGHPPVETATSLRMTGPFSAPRVGIMLAWMSIPVVAYWLMNEGGGARKDRSLSLGIFFAVGLISVIFISGERMALLLTGLAFCIAFFIFPISKKLMIALGLACALLVGAFAYSNQALIERQLDSTTETMEGFSGSDYGQIWISAVEVFKAYPITGAGLRQFRVICHEARFGATDETTLASRCNQHTHNMYLEWLSESGLIGFGLFMSIIILILHKAFAHYRTLRTNPLFIGLLITLFIRLWPLASTTSFFTSWSAVPFWLTAGWLLAIIHHKESAV